MNKDDMPKRVASRSPRRNKENDIISSEDRLDGNGRINLSSSGDGKPLRRKVDDRTINSSNRVNPNETFSINRTGDNKKSDKGISLRDMHVARRGSGARKTDKADAENNSWLGRLQNKISSGDSNNKEQEVHHRKINQEPMTRREAQERIDRPDVGHGNIHIADENSYSAYANRYQGQAMQDTSYRDNPINDRNYGDSHNYNENLHYANNTDGDNYSTNRYSSNNYGEVNYSSNNNNFNGTNPGNRDNFSSSNVSNGIGGGNANNGSGGNNGGSGGNGGDDGKGPRKRRRKNNHIEDGDDSYVYIGEEKTKNHTKLIYTVAAIYMLMFAVLIGYLSYFTVCKRDEMSVKPQNKRLTNQEQEIIRGKIYDCSGERVLAESTTDDDRSYPYDNLYSHVVGYSQLGKTGAEAIANQQLLCPNYSFLSVMNVALFNGKFEGRSVVLTVDHDYQSAIAEALQGKKGSAVVLEASTGKIKAMYSNPNFNPNNIIADWTALNTDEENAPLVNRSTQGLYPPGSIFKIVTTFAYMQQGKGLGYTYNCTGSVHEDNYDIKCFNGNVHGEQNLDQAFANSCNTYFINLARTLPKNALEKAAKELGFNNDLLVSNFPYKQSRFNLSSKDNQYEKDATAIGQGRTMVSPFHMAMIASSIINDGICMEPYVVDYAFKPSNHQVVDRHMPKQGETLFTEEETAELQKLMEKVVDEGTGATLPEGNLVVGGKTGTAENSTGKDHSWFIGYAKDPANPNKSPLAYAIIVEEGTGKALTVADSILNVYRNK